MSIDVFGHPLNRTAVSNRGPSGLAGTSGAGFKLTSDGNYDIEGKRLQRYRSYGSNRCSEFKTCTAYSSERNTHCVPGQIIFAIRIKILER